MFNKNLYLSALLLLILSQTFITNNSHGGDGHYGNRGSSYGRSHGSLPAGKLSPQEEANKKIEQWLNRLDRLRN